MWAQWVLGHLTDSDVVGLLARCRAGLRQGGALVVKDNTASAADCDQCGGHYLLDEENAAVIRSHAHLKSLFKLAGLKLAQNATQTGCAPGCLDARAHTPPAPARTHALIHDRRVCVRMCAWADSPRTCTLYACTGCCPSTQPAHDDALMLRTGSGVCLIWPASSVEGRSL